MTIGQEQLMRRKEGNTALPLQLKTPTKSFGWKIIEVAFYLWVAAVVVICAMIVIFG